MGLLKAGKIIVSLLLFVARFLDLKARAHRYAVPESREVSGDTWGLDVWPLHAV